jgi:pterin-4a-carbinolamine dehydratase
MMMMMMIEVSDLQQWSVQQRKHAAVRAYTAGKHAGVMDRADQQAPKQNHHGDAEQVVHLCMDARCGTSCVSDHCNRCS